MVTSKLLPFIKYKIYFSWCTSSVRKIFVRIDEVKGMFCSKEWTFSARDTIHSFWSSVLYSQLLGPGLFFSFVIFFTERAGHVGRVISPSQGRYLHTGQYKHRINAHTNIHALSGIRTHDPRVRAREDNSCGHCDRQRYNYVMKIYSWKNVLLYISLKP
jgi:hypothetical protein